MLRAPWLVTAMVVALASACAPNEEGLYPRIGGADAGRGRGAAPAGGGVDGGAMDGAGTPLPATPVVPAADAGAPPPAPPFMTGPQAPAPTPAPPQQQLRPGVFVELFEIGAPMERLPTLMPGQSPNFVRYEDVIDYPARGGFGALTDRFFVRVRGYLVVTTVGAHVLRLTSDDGARMWMELGGVRQLVIDNDGVHFATARDTTVVLSPGMYRFEIQMFENDFFEQLTLAWRTPGSGGFDVVPTALLRVEANLQVPTSPGKKKIGGQGKDDDKDDDKKDD